MYENWEHTQPYTHRLTGAADISAVLRAVDDAEWELDEELQFNEPFDPFADDPE